jgi:phosphoserine phosphatase
VNGVGLARQAWRRLGQDSVHERVAEAVPRPGQANLVRSGVAAGATIVVLSAASAVTSAIRRRTEGA